MGLVEGVTGGGTHVRKKYGVGRTKSKCCGCGITSMGEGEHKRMSNGVLWTTAW